MVNIQKNYFYPISFINLCMYGDVLFFCCQFFCYKIQKLFGMKKWIICFSHHTCLKKWKHYYLLQLDGLCYKQNPKWWNHIDCCRNNLTFFVYRKITLEKQFYSSLNYNFIKIFPFCFCFRSALTLHLDSCCDYKPNWWRHMNT